MSNVTIRDIRTISTAPGGVDLLVVKVETSEAGLYGLGCATFTQRWRAVEVAVNEYLKPLLVGRSVDNIEDIWQQAMCNGYWRNGPVLNNALSGVDEALWDIKGKMAGMPVYDLLGGRARNAAAVYRHADGATVQQVEENIRRYMEQGYRYVRAQMGTYGGQMGGRKQTMVSPEGSPEGAYFDPATYRRDTVKLFDHLRSALGDEVELLHDVHERLQPIDAIRLAKELEPYHLFFLEDALPPEQVEWFAHMRHQTTTPIAMGELFNHPLEYKNLIADRLIDFVRAHISQLGGLTPARKLAILCETFGVRTAWHGPPDLTPVGVAANLHLDLVSHNFGIQEYHGFCEEEQEVFSGCPEIRDGYMYPNDKPGFGVDLDEKAAAKYPAGRGANGEGQFGFLAQHNWLRARLPDGTAVRP